MGKALAIAAGCVLLIGTISPIWATTDFNAYMPINGAPITPSFKFTRVVNLDYSNGGKLKDALDGKNVTVSFSYDASNNPSVNNLMQYMNTAMDMTGSAVRLTGLKLDYLAQINGYPTQASITYMVTLTPTIVGYVLYQGTANVAGIMGGGTPYIMDAAWAGFNVDQPVAISTPQYGNLEINYPISLIQKELPTLYGVIHGTSAEKLLESNLLNPSGLYGQQPLAKWDSLFDPSYVVSDANVLNYQGAKVAVTTFSTGVSSLQSGAMNSVTQNADFMGDAAYKISVIDQPASGTFNVEGHAQAYNVKGAPAFTTTIDAAGGVSTTTAGGISNMTTYGMAGGAGVIAIFIFIWSNKKMKQDKALANEPPAPVAPVQYETRHHWADKFDAEPKPSVVVIKKEEPDWLCFKCGYYILKNRDHCTNCGTARPDGR